MGPVVMRIVSLTGRASLSGQDPDARVGQWVKEFYPEAFLGRGDLMTTDVLAEAKTWPDGTAAWREWRTIPKARRVRRDGQPNRPFTAFTVEIILKEHA